MRRIFFLLLLAGIGYVLYKKFLGSEPDYVPEANRDTQEESDEPSF